MGLETPTKKGMRDMGNTMFCSVSRENIELKEKLKENHTALVRKNDLIVELRRENEELKGELEEKRGVLALLQRLALPRKAEEFEAPTIEERVRELERAVKDLLSHTHGEK